MKKRKRKRKRERYKVEREEDANDNKVSEMERRRERNRGSEGLTTWAECNRITRARGKEIEMTIWRECGKRKLMW